MTIHLSTLGPDLPVHSTPHPHTGLPIYAIGLRRNGDPIWPAIGASGDDTGGDGGADGGDDAGDDSGDGDDGGDGDADKGDLGDAGKKALDTMKADRNKAKAALRPWSTLARELGVKTPEELKALVSKAKGGGTDDAPDPEKVKADARAEADQKANARIVRSEVKAAAGGKLADPNDAVRLLDLSEFEVDEDGEVDEEAIAEAIADLLKKKPYLAADASKRFKGGGDGGNRGGEQTDPGPGKARLLAAFASTKK